MGHLEGIKKLNAFFIVNKRNKPVLCKFLFSKID